MSEQVSVYLDFKGKKLLITKHSIERLKERWGNVHASPVGDPLRRIKSMLYGGIRNEKIDLRHVIGRLLKHKGIPVEYYRSGHFRLVISENNLSKDELVLVTIEVARPPL